jgi:hypothetical protein
MTGADAFALAQYETALQQFQGYVGRPRRNNRRGVCRRHPRSLRATY